MSTARFSEYLEEELHSKAAALRMGTRAGAAAGALIGAGHGIYKAPKKKDKKTALKDIAIQAAGGALIGAGAGRGLESAQRGALRSYHGALRSTVAVGRREASRASEGIQRAVQKSRSGIRRDAASILRAARGITRKEVPKILEKARAAARAEAPELGARFAEGTKTKAHVLGRQIRRGFFGLKTSSVEKVAVKPAWIAKHTVRGLVARGDNPKSAKRAAGLVAALYRQGRSIPGLGSGPAMAGSQLGLYSKLYPKGGPKLVPPMKEEELRLLPKGFIPALVGGAALGATITAIRRRKQREKKATAAQIGQIATGLSGLGTHIARTVRQRGGTFDMMMLGLQDPTTSQFAGQLMGMVDSGRYGQARQTVIMANFPEDMRDRILGTLDHLRSQPGIPEAYRQQNLLSAFDPR